MKIDFDYKDLCRPARIYFYFTVLSTIIALFQGMALGSIVINVLFMGFWMWFLNKLCSWGYRTAAWIALFLPLILFFIGIILIISALAK